MTRILANMQSHSRFRQVPVMKSQLKQFALLSVALAACGALLPTPTFAVDPAVLEAQQRRIEVVQQVSPSVVAIFARGGQGGGSGVLISPDGYVLTNFHVTRGAGTFMKCGLSDGVLYDAVIVGIDPTGDVAMVKLLGRDDFPYATLGDSDKCRPGEWAYAMGNPFLLATDFQTTVTYGIISGVHRYQYPAGKNFLEYGDCIQIDTSINPGNSGGPLFNDQGELIGINGRGSFEKRGRVNSGAGYAISINQIKHFMGHLRSGRIVDHATLGATVVTREDGAVIVGNILENAEAYRRGLRIDDEIVSFAGRSIRSVNQYKNVLSIYPKGWVLPVVYRRDGDKHTIAPRLRALHHKSDFQTKKKPPVRRPPPKKPDDKQPKGKKTPDGKPPGNHPAPKAAGPPEKFKHMFIEKEGFANFYFNKLELDRTLDGLKSWGDFSQADGKWILTGTNALGSDFEFILTEQRLALAMNDKIELQVLDGKELVPEPAGGLLIAMHHLKLLITGRQHELTEFLYLGSEPLDGEGRLVDVVVGKLDVAQTRWYFDRQDGRLLGLDTQLGDDVDECELRFSQPGTFDGRKLPGTISIRHAEKDFATLKLQKAVFTKRPAKETRPKAG